MPPSSDPGVQNERTALSWQRTALSLLAGAAAVSRVTADQLGTVALVPVLTALPLTVLMFFEGRGRYQHDARIRPRATSRDGKAPADLALVLAIMAATELVALFHSS